MSEIAKQGLLELRHCIFYPQFLILLTTEVGLPHDSLCDNIQLQLFFSVLNIYFDLELEDFKLRRVQQYRKNLVRTLSFPKENVYSIIILFL